MMASFMLGSEGDLLRQVFPFVIAGTRWCIPLVGKGKRIFWVKQTTRTVHVLREGVSF